MKAKSKATKVTKKVSPAYQPAVGNSTRYTYRPKASDEQKELAASKTMEVEPKGYLMLKQVVLEANKMSIPTSRVMKAMGGNRGVGEPLNTNWVFVYYKRSRWLPKACLKDLPKLAAQKRTAGRPAQAKAERKPVPFAKHQPVAKPASGTPKGFVREKGKLVKKADPKDIPGAKAVLKPKPVVKGKMSTTRVVDTAGVKKGKTLKTRKTVNEAGIPVLQLVDEQE